MSIEKIRSAAFEAGLISTETTPVFTPEEYLIALEAFTRIMGRTREDTVELPRSVPKAELMVKVGLSWLTVYAPEKLGLPYRAYQALEMLVKTKRYKDQNGKDDQYEKMRTEAWAAAEKIIS